MTTQAVAVARPALPRASVWTKPRARTRIAYIDNLRVLLVILLVWHHAAVTYGAEGSWHYYERPVDLWTAALLTLFTAVNQAFFMAFYFAIAAYFTEASLQRRPARRFIADRLLRLGVPLALQILAIAPLLSYFLSVTVWGFQDSLADHLRIYVFRDGGIDVGSLWFVEALLIFSLAYVCWRRCSGHSQDNVSHTDLPTDRTLALFAVGIGLLAFVVRLAYPVGRLLRPFGFQLAHFPQYIAWFVAGAVAYRRGWLAGLSDERGRAWGRVAIVCIVVAPLLYAAGGALGGSTAPFMGGMHWQALVYAVLEQFLCLGMIIGLLVAFRRRFDRQGRLAREMSASAYTVYILHSTVLVLITVAMRDWALWPLLKFALASLLAVPSCFLLAAGVRRLPGARSIL
jgi:glucan biosynthesis protein C